MTNTIIKKFFLFFCILFAFDFLAGSVLKKLYSLQKRGTNFRTAYLIKECQADIVILGSSRASRHYATDVMSEISGLVCYNGGRDGTMFDYAYACASSILKRYHPKLIIIDLNLLDFYNSPSADEQLNSLLPYYNDDVEIKKVVDDVRGPFEKYKHLSFTYPFNNTLLNSVINLLLKPTSHDTSGYLPLWGADVNEPDTIRFQNHILNIRRIKYLHDLANRCKQNGTELHLVYSPRFAWFTNQVIFSEIEKITQTHGIPFHRFDNDKEYLNKPEWFKDSAHLNHNGATAFTYEITSRITHHTSKRL